MYPICYGRWGCPVSRAKETNIQARNRVLAACAAICLLVIALLLFMNANTKRIVTQNDQYLETSTGQTTRRVNDTFDASLRVVQTAATIFETNLQSPDIDPIDAVNVLDLSQFDDSYFIMADGMAYNRDGRKADATDRYYYSAGMAGESGVCYIPNAIFGGQNVIAFFAPVHYQYTVVGVMVSVYHEDSLTEIMTTEFYGDPTPTYLCTPDGIIVARATPQASTATSINEVFSDDQVDGETLESLDGYLASGTNGSFNYKTPEGVGNTYVSRLQNYEWSIVRSFPAEITNKMVINATFAGIFLIVGVIIAALIVIAVLLLQARQRNTELLLERQEATRIIDASTNLYNCVLSLDLVNKTYESLKNDDALGALLPDGSYDYLCQTFSQVMDKPTETSDDLVFLDIEATQKALGPGVSFVQQECRTKDNKEPRWFQVSTLCVARDVEGVATNVLVTIQDATEAKTKEIMSRVALEDAFGAAEHASKAKSDFLNSMSHDIRTPMNSIMGLTAIAGMHVDNPDRVRECLARITSASKHLLGLINEVLDMAKIESGAIGLNEEPFVLSESIGSLITLMNPQIMAKHQELKVEIADIKHEHVIGDQTRLQQVFVNIMGNSIKFTPEGGQIGLRIAELPSRIPEHGCYEFTFTDTGCGMSPEFLETVFEPFTRANDSRTTKIEGTGLGMAIVKSVVSLMSGTVDVDSVEGEGSTFTVVVHLKLSDKAQEDISDLCDIHVLVVDDDVVACEGACAMLEEVGMRSSYVLSGQEGINAVIEAKQQNDPFRAVILDWRMPEMNGIETARRIHEAVLDAIPIIVLSAYDWSMIEQEAREVGVDAFISKPLFKTRLIRVMKELISGEAQSFTDERSLFENLSFEGKRILLVEDSVMAAAVAQELIELTGAAVDHVENGKLAFEALRDHEPGYYTMVLMDIQMPVMNGYEATAAIRKEGEVRSDMAQIPIVALSADAFAEDVRRAHSVGMNDHMSKPLDVDTFARMLRKWVS